MKRVLSLPAAFLVVAIASGARAAEPAAADAAAAMHFFQLGRDAMARGDHAAACQNLEESLRLEVAAGTLFNLAQCEEAQGALASAWEHLRAGVERLPLGDPRRRSAEAAARALEPRVPHVSVALAAEGAGASTRAFRDGVALSPLSLGVLLPVNPGRHTVVVRAEGHTDAVYGLVVVEGERRQIVVSRGPASIPRTNDAVSTKNPAGRSGTLRTAAWITGGLGLAAVGTGAVAGVLAMTKASAVREHCDSARTCDDAGIAALDAARPLTTASTVAFAAGAGLTVAAAVMFFVTRKAPLTTSAGRIANLSWQF